MILSILRVPFNCNNHCKNAPYDVYLLLKELIVIITKNQTLEVTITDVTASGDGVAKAEGYPLFIKGGITDDVLNVTVTKTNKSYGFAKINKILIPSPARINPTCPVFENCGGCDFMHIDYNTQKEIKSNIVLNNIQRLGSVAENEYTYEEIIGADHIYGYRNKAQFPIGKSEGKIICGFYSKRSHNIVPCNNCLIQNPRINKAVELFLEYANEERLSVYDEKTHKGILRHIYVRAGHGTEDILVVIVTNSHKLLPDSHKLISKLKEIEGLKGIIQNINTDKTNLILGKDNLVLFGENSLMSKINDLKFKIASESFFQVNGTQTEKLYGKALEYADLTGKETVFDLYCGVGSISLFLAQKANKVIGVEIVPEAIENAKENAVLNNISNAEFYAGDCGKIVGDLIAGGESADVVVVDPPRKGCSEELLAFLRDISPQKIVYVSCNSATLARDIKILKEYGYNLQKACAVDMFPMSGHVESVALLTLSTSI